MSTEQQLLIALQKTAAAGSNMENTANKPEASQRQMDKERIQELEAEIAETKKEKSEIQKKYDEFKATRKRQNAVEEEVASLKKQVEVLEKKQRKNTRIIEKTYNDNKRIFGESYEQYARIGDYEKTFARNGIPYNPYE